MRVTLSTLRRPGRARVTRLLRRSKIGAVVGANRAITNPMANARMGNQTINPMVDTMVGVQAAAEVANNASTKPVNEFGEGVISHGLAAQ